MRKITIAALAAAAMLPFQLQSTATAATLELKTAQDLVDLCAVADDEPNVEGARGFCYGFMSGAGHYHRAINAGKKAKPLFCLPEPKPSRAEGAKLFVAWAKANPQHMGEEPVDALMRFAAATWPCAPAKKR
jgi:hypothetical protein